MTLIILRELFGHTDRVHHRCSDQPSGRASPLGLATSIERMIDNGVATPVPDGNARAKKFPERQTKARNSSGIHPRNLARLRVPRKHFRYWKGRLPIRLPIGRRTRS